MSATSNATILIVEDEVLVRLDLASYLENAGYRVLEAGSAREAIEILERDRSIRVVFTDVQMPGDMDGLALARCIRERWPPTIIVVSSANTFHRDEAGADIHLLDKPYTVDHMKLVLEAVADQPARVQSYIDRSFAAR